MIIKNVIIENFLCYFAIKEFEFSDGLNIILGDNGEGKTKFFEAIDWLFNGDDKNLDLLVSAKAISETELNDQFRVRVSIIVEQYDEKKVITKSFIVKKTDHDNIVISNYSLEGIEENKQGERNQVNGNILLDQIFPHEIRRYSLFKGEAELNIFENDEALGILINSFSRAKYYEKIAQKGILLREEAEKAVDRDTKRNSENQKQYKILEAEIKKFQDDKNKIGVYIGSTEEQIRKIEKFIQEAEKFVNNAEALETINNRIKKIEEEIKKTEKIIEENYTTNLFDESWILVKFEQIHHAFVKKVQNFNIRKREIQSEFDKQVGIEEGKKSLKKELLNNYIPLPVGMPPKGYMKEMIKDKICKVCGRDLDDNALGFMNKRLEEYIASQEPETIEKPEKQVLFKHDYLNRLLNLSVSHEDNLSKLRRIRKIITEFFEFNNERKKELNILNEKLNKELSDRDKIIGSSSVGADKLSNVLKNYNGWQRDIKNLNGELNDYKSKLKEIDDELSKINKEKDNIDIKTANNFLIRTRTILRDIEIIFKDTKENKFDEFIDILQEKSNSIFQTINVEDFTGTIIFNKKKMGSKTTVDIELEEDGRVFYSPNQSLETSMHMAILFAISEIASELREENFPMIFDAPTSSFGETKTKDFLNLVFDTKKQRIILFYDFIGKDENGNLFIKPEFNDVNRHKAFWIRRERPFDKNKLKTINTKVTNI
jgi:DNA sulfur modification protein DndD